MTSNPEIEQAHAGCGGGQTGFVGFNPTQRQKSNSKQTDSVKTQFTNVENIF